MGQEKMIGLLGLVVIAGLGYVFKPNEQEDLENSLESIVKILYSFANCDGIHPKEDKLIKEFYDAVLKEIKTEDRRKELTQKITVIRRKKDTIKLSDSLSSLLKNKEWEKVFKAIGLTEILQDLIDSDAIKSDSEKKLIKYYNDFVRTPTSETIRKIKIQEAEDLIPIPTHYKYINKSSEFFSKSEQQQKNGLVFLYKDCHKFRNMSSLVESEYYIAHPNDSNYLYPLSQLEKVKENTIEEFLSIAALLGALEIEIEIIKDAKESMDDSSHVNAEASSIHGEVKVSVDSKNSKQEDSYSQNRRIKKYKTGAKEDKKYVISKQIWTKGVAQVNELIDSTYSKNPLAEWEEEIYLKSFVSNYSEQSLKGALKIASLYDLNLNIDFETTRVRFLEERMKIRIKF